MSNLQEILANSALIIGLTTFLGMCFWSMHDLDKDDKKRRKARSKTKKA